MQRQVRLTEQARNDLLEIWHYTAAQYDIEQADAYSDLLHQAIRDIEREPERATSQARDELGTGIRSYRIELSKHRSGSGIKSGRHVVFYTLAYDPDIHVIRILHERMDPQLHLDPES